MKITTNSPPPRIQPKAPKTAPTPAIASTPTNRLNQKHELPQSLNPPPTPGKAWRGKRTHNDVVLDNDGDGDEEPFVPLFLPQRYSIFGQDQNYAGFNRAGENPTRRDASNASNGSVKIANDSLFVQLRPRPLFGTMIHHVHPDQPTPESPESQIKEPQLPFLFEDESTEIEPRVAADFDGQ